MSILLRYQIHTHSYWIFHIHEKFSGREEIHQVLTYAGALNVPKYVGTKGLPHANELSAVWSLDGNVNNEEMSKIFSIFFFYDKLLLRCHSHTIVLKRKLCVHIVYIHTCVRKNRYAHMHIQVNSYVPLLISHWVPCK